MNVTVKFTDGEVMHAESDAATLTKMGFPISFRDGNNRIAWVSLAAIKYVRFNDSGFGTNGATEDPRDHEGFPKLVLRFLDGEIMRAYKDDTFSQSDEGFTLRIWDEDKHQLTRYLVSLHALKAIFYVDQWDSRSEEEKLRWSGTQRVA